MKPLMGRVISSKMQQTVVVEVSRVTTHPIYGKRIRRTRNYPVHDPVGAKVDDIVKLTSTRPISRTKHWQVSEIVKAYGPN